MIGSANISSGGGLSKNNAILHIICETGTFIRVTAESPYKLINNFNPEDMIIDQDNQFLSHCYCSIEPADFGPITVYVYSEKPVVEGTFYNYIRTSIFEAKLYDVEAILRYFLIKNGEKANNITIKNDGGTLTTETGAIVLSSPASSGSRATLYIIPNIDVTNFTSLYFTGPVRGYYKANEVPAFGLIKEHKSGSAVTTFYKSGMLLSSGTGTWSGVKLPHSIAIDDLSGKYIIGATEAGSGANNWEGGLKIEDLYLGNYSINHQKHPT